VASERGDTDDWVDALVLGAGSPGCKNGKKKEKYVSTFHFPGAVRSVGKATYLSLKGTDQQTGKNFSRLVAVADVFECFGCVLTTDV
jgi:hypothetical protein